MAKKIIVSIFVAYALILIIIIAAGIYKPPNSENQVHIIMSQEPEDLNPIFGSMSAASEVERTIFKPMVDIKKDGTAIPVLVESIPTLKNGGVELLENGKKMRVIWTFKKGLVWEDKHPLGPEDVIFTWKVKMHKDVQVASRDVEERIESMEVDPLNPRKLIVTWKETFAFYSQGHPILPKHILEKEFKKSPARFHLIPYNKKPIGNGPYKIVEWKNGSYIYLKRNENFPANVGSKAKFDTIWYQFIGDTNTMMVSILSGYGDAISPVGVSLDQILDFKKRYGKSFNTYFVDGIVWEHLDINMDDPILKDKRVRQAIFYAINRENIVKFLYDNQLNVAHSWLPPQHPGYLESIKKYPHNPKKAIALLEEAGWDRLNDNNIRINHKGERLKLSLITTAGNKVRERVQVVIKENLRKVGIELNIGGNQNAIALFGETIPKRKFQLAMYAHIFSPVAHGEDLWRIKYIPSEKNNYLGGNTPGYRNKEVDLIHKKIPTALDPKERKKLFQQQQRIWIEDLPTIPLYFRKEVSITKPDFKNWKPVGTDTPVTWNVENWYLD